MDTEQKTITKEDGRILHYYHFPKTATQSQTLAFESVDPDKVDGGHTPHKDKAQAESPEVRATLNV